MCRYTQEAKLPQVSRLRAHHELNELRSDELRFSLDEIKDFLRSGLEVDISPALVEHLEERTEGWGAGLRLLVQALQSKSTQREIEDFLTKFTGNQKQFVEYIVEDILADQPESTQTFLRETAHLKRLNASLCDAVIDRADSQLILETLERGNLFLSTLSTQSTNKWYRYHPLFVRR